LEGGVEERTRTEKSWKEALKKELEPKRGEEGDVEERTRTEKRRRRRR